MREALRTDERRIDPALTAVYGPEVLTQVPRLLGSLDRERHSPSAGSFDRDQWGWKFRDHPLGMLQVSVYPLALLWRHRLEDNPYHRSSRLLEWIALGFEETLDRQHRNGALSAFVPYEQDPMSTLAIMHGLARAYRTLGDALPAGLVDRFLEGFRRACAFCRTREEDHAFVSNHWALFAVAWLDAYEMLGEDGHRARAEAVIDRILEEQSPDGWYREYGGPDPGYETFGLLHLAAYWHRTGSARVLESMRKSVAFLAHGVHPDGSLGGVYGSRHTSLYMPGGLELLAHQLPMAAAIARFLRDRLPRRNVVTPATADAENLPPLAYAYLEACLAPPASDADVPKLPCERSDLRADFEESGLTAVSTSRYYAVISASKGGVCRVFDRAAERLAYEDAGYLVRANGRSWTSQMLGSGRREPSDEPGGWGASTTFVEVSRPRLTPLRFVVLRLLNLTLFRHPRLGNWLRKQIAVRLILSSRSGPFRLERRVRFLPERMEVSDRLERTGSIRVEGVEAPRTFTAIHMGSARYFHPAELEETLDPPVEGLAERLEETGAAERAFALDFSDGSAALRSTSR